MNWIEVKAILAAPPDDWSIWIDCFSRHGCENSLQDDDPPALSSALVDVDGSPEVLQALTGDLLRLGAASVQTRNLVEENWEEVWKRFFHPRPVGKGFVVSPTWERAEPGQRREIVLDPGQAFGTGDHPTTRMCLELLEREDMNGKRAADVGCGSGILSIGAALLGASEVVAADIEPLSAQVARENAALNGVRIDVRAGGGIEAVEDRGPFDVLLTNIISAVLIQLSPRARAVIAPGGKWILSGVIEDNWPDVLAAAEATGFTLVTRIEEDGWVAATLRA